MTTAQLGDKVTTTYYAGDFILQAFRDDGVHRFACLVRPVIAKQLTPGQEPRLRDAWVVPPSTLTKQEG